MLLVRWSPLAQTEEGITECKLLRCCQGEFEAVYNLSSSVLLRVILPMNDT